jgi:chitodextrinase
MGFYLTDFQSQVPAVRNGDFGFTSFTATDGTTTATDAIAPSTPTNLAAAGISTSQINLSWTASTDNAGVSGYRVYRNGSQIATTSTTNYSDSGLAAGTVYSYNVSAFDAAGNISPQSSPASGSTLTGDSQAPTVSISSPTNEQVLSGAVQIVANAADNVGVAGVRIYLDGTALVPEITASPYSTTWNTTQAANGSHVLTAMARDSAGNTTTSSGVSVSVSNTSSSPRPYVTNFTMNENPISENNNWINGKSTGLDWSDVRVNQGLAYGTQVGIGGNDDSIAILSGNWSSDQSAHATVHTVNQNNQLFEEVELRLRTTITAHSITGYLIKFRCTADGTQYVQIARWDGTLGNVTMIDGRTGPGLRDGDVVGASIVGSTITAYINGSEVFHLSDSTYTNGSPGMGFFLADYLNEVAAVRNGDFGFTSFTASDGTTTDLTAPSTPANLAAAGYSPSQINLSWSPSSDDVSVAGYQIFRNGTRIANSTTNSYSDAGLNANTQYTYTVTAFDAAGNVSLQSSPSTGTTLSADTTSPSVPSNLQSSNVTSNSVRISWSASTDDTGVAGYDVFRDGTKAGTTTIPSYVDSGLAASTTYRYTVVAFDGSNNWSLQSQQLSVTTTSSNPSAPVFLQEREDQIASGTSVSVGFSNPTSAGNTIVAYVIWSNTNSVALTDSRGDAFVGVGSPVIWAGRYSAQVFYATGISGGAATVTATFRDAVGVFGVMYIHEYSGISTVNPVDVTAAAAGSSASMSSGGITTTSPNDLIFGAGVSDNTVTSTDPAFNVRSLAFGNITEDRTAASVGSYAATATHYGTDWGMQVVAFRPAN